jgi:hypothetical protein
MPDCAIFESSSINILPHNSVDSMAFSWNGFFKDLQNWQVLNYSSNFIVEVHSSIRCAENESTGSSATLWPMVPVSDDKWRMMTGV